MRRPPVFCAGPLTACLPVAAQVYMRCDSSDIPQ